MMRISCKRADYLIPWPNLRAPFAPVIERQARMLSCGCAGRGKSQTAIDMDLVQVAEHVHDDRVEANALGAAG